MAHSAVIKHDVGYLSTLPLGSIIAWHRDFSETHAVPLPPGWAECNGQVLDDPESPYHDHVIPNLNGDAGAGQGGFFLRGKTRSGDLQEDQVQSHKHDDRGHIHHIKAVGGSAPEQSWYNLGVINSLSGGRVPTDSAHADLWNPTETDAGEPRHGAETRPVNMSVVWIMKIKQVTAVRAVPAIEAHSQAPLGAVYIGAEGRVGIGTGNRVPAAELEVEGSIRTNGIQVTGPVSAPGALQSFFDQAPKWENTTTSQEYSTLITRKLEVVAPTNVVVIGHGYGHVVSGAALVLAIFIDDSGGSRGRAYNQSRDWAQISAYNGSLLPPGKHVIRLRFAVDQPGAVNFNNPTMITMLMGSQ